MKTAAARNGLSFRPDYIDTLAAAHHLLPELTRFKLDTVSNHLKLPKFNHHRASDDAAVVARIMEKFIPMLHERGVKTLNDINSVCRDSSHADKTYHMILLVQNRKGLKNLYELISKSYLEHFYRTPNIPKDLLLKHREGLLIGSACGIRPSACRI